MEIGYPVAMKIASGDILHKSEAGGVALNLVDASAVEAAYNALLASAKNHNVGAKIDGILVQKMVPAGIELIVGALTDPSFGKLVALGVGGVLVEILKDVTFHLAPVTFDEARAMLDGIRTRELLDGMRGGEAVDRDALAALVTNVAQLVDDFPAIAEVDLNPVFASARGAIAADVRILVDFAPAPVRFRPSRDEILRAMNRIMRPESIAIIGASAEDGKIGNSVLKNLINGGYQGRIFPIHPSLDAVLGRKAFRNIKEVPALVDVAVFAFPARLVAPVLAECGAKSVAGAVLIPSGFAETGNDGFAARGARGRASAQYPAHGAEHLRLLLHAEKPVRDVLYALRREGQGRVVVAERRRRNGDPRIQPIHENGCVGDRGSGQQGGYRRR